MLAPWKKSYDQPRQHIKRQRYYFANKVPSSQGYGFSSSHDVWMWGCWMWELDYKESSAPNNWCFWTVVLEKTLESPLDCKEIQPVHSKGNQSWMFIGRTDVEAETPIFWLPDAKNWLMEKTLILGKTEGGRRRGRQRMRCWMASPTRWTWVWVNYKSWRWTGKPGVLSPWGHKQLNMTEQLNWTELKQVCRQRKGSIKGRNQICRKEIELLSEHSPLESKKKWTDKFQVKSWLLDWKKGYANTT